MQEHVQERSGNDSLKYPPRFALHERVHHIARCEAHRCRRSNDGQAGKRHADAVEGTKQEPDSETDRKPVEDDGHGQHMAMARCIRQLVRREGDPIHEGV